MEKQKIKIDDPQAIELFKASHYCYQVEKKIKSTMIVMALFFSLISIIIRFLPDLAALFGAIRKTITVIVDGNSVASENPAYTKFAKNCKTIGDVISFISGIWLILQIILSSKAVIKHKEAVNLEERYDNLVLGLEPNKNIMRPITNGMIRNYASRVNNNKMKFCKDIDQEPSPKLTIFIYQKKCFEHTYGLLIFAKNRFFNIIWWAYFILIIGFSLIIETTVLNALTTIFFPSLSAITLIVNSMISYNEQFRYNSNAIDCIKSIEDEVNEKGINVSPHLLRNIQDSLFIGRLNSFSVPKFVENIYVKSLVKNDNQEADSTPVAKAPKKKSTPKVVKQAVVNPKANVKPKEEVVKAKDDATKPVIAAKPTSEAKSVVPGKSTTKTSRESKKVIPVNTKKD